MLKMPTIPHTDLYKRFLFNTRTQHLGETIEDFLDILKQLSKNCKYEQDGANPSQIDFLIRDRFIGGIRNKNAQKQLLQYQSRCLPIDKAVNLALQHDQKIPQNDNLESEKELNLSHNQNIFCERINKADVIKDEVKDSYELISQNGIQSNMDESFDLNSFEEQTTQEVPECSLKTVIKTDLLQFDIEGCDEFENGEEDVYEHLNCQNEAKIDKHNENSTTKIDETIISIQTTKKKNQSNLRVPQICLLCKEVCVDKKALNAHMKKKHKKSQRHPVKCDECDTEFSNIYKLKQHMIRRHPIVLDCSTCKDLSNNKVELIKHINEQHKDFSDSKEPSDTSKTCLICQKSYSDKYALRMHMKRLHDDLLDKDNEKVCCLCEESVQDLKEHMENKHADTGLMCKVCNKQLRQDESLRSHFIQMHSQSGKTICQFCGGSFSNIESHVATLHLNEKPHKCDKCEYSHATKVGLKNHKLYFHPKGNAHMCHMCPYKSHHKSNLKQHIQVVHEKEKPFKCPLCEKTFFHRGAMKDHVNVVHEKKLFTCKYCSKTFSNRCGFNSHVKSVHEGRWEYCTLCKGKFQDKGDLRRHTKNVHERNYSFRCDKCGRGFPYRTPMKDHMMKHHGIRLEDTIIQMQQQYDKNLSRSSVLSHSQSLDQDSDLNISLNKNGDEMK